MYRGRREKKKIAPHTDLTEMLFYTWIYAGRP